MSQELKVLYNFKKKTGWGEGNEARIEGIVQFTKTKRDGVGNEPRIEGIVQFKTERGWGEISHWFFLSILKLNV